MHNNYYFLKQLSPVLEEKLEGLELVECFSQNKDELILGELHNDAAPRSPVLPQWLSGAAEPKEGRVACQ